MTAPVVIVGAGGHARVVADTLLASGRIVAGFIDADECLWGTVITGLPVLGGDAVLDAPGWAGHALVNAIGANPLRETIQRRLEAAGWKFTGARHPRAAISSFATLDESVQVFANAVVQPGAVVGPGCIINTGAIVEHDCDLGPFTHCAPGSVLCGGVTTGPRVHIGAGAVVRENITLGADVTVGAGAAVVRDHTDPGLLKGVPARP